MATSRGSHLHRPIQLSATSQAQCSDRLAVPKYHTLDPLLGSLSPESTLQALSSTNAVPRNEQAAHDILTQSISKVSPAERALGIRAAVAAQKLGVWYKEVQEWEWPKRADAHLGKGFIPPSVDTGYCGSLPSSAVEEHANRIEEIRDGMESLNVEELKEHVLNAHIPGRSRPSSSHSTISIPPPLSYVQLSDFTAVITATILRALPFLSRLNSLLSTWDVRLLVLRQIPALLQGLQFARSEMDSALGLLKSPNPPAEHEPLYCISNYHVKRASLEAMVVSTGRRMDRILDSLEGREDSLPESWIDDLEAIESDFGTWVVEAERRAVRTECSRMTAHPGMDEKPEPVQTRQEFRTAEAINEPNVDVPVLEKTTVQPIQTPSASLPATPQIEFQKLEHQNEPVSLQVGRATPMETIAEETGSYFEPIPSTPVPVVEVLQSDGHSIDDSPSVSSSDERDIREASPEFDRNTPSLDMKIAGSSPTPPGLAEEDAQNEITVKKLGDDGPCLVSSTPVEEYSEDSIIIRPREVASSVSQDNAASIASEGNLSDDPVEDVQPQPEPEPETEPASPAPNKFVEVEKSTEVLGQTPPSTPPLEASPGMHIDTKPSVTPQLRTPESSPRLEQHFSTSTATQPKFGEELEPIAEIEDLPQPVVTRDQPTTPNRAYMQAPPVQPAPVAAIPTELPSARSLSPLLESPNLFVPFDSSRSSPACQKPEVADQTVEDPPPKQPLESPIKLSKFRPGRLDLEKHDSKPRGRRSSNASAESLSDYPSLVSSPEIHEPRTSSSNGTPVLLETPPHFPTDFQPTEPVPPSNDHTLREDRLFRLESEKASPREAFAHNRTLSLPLQRFINERLDLNYEHESSVDEESFNAERSSSSVAPQNPLGKEKNPVLRRQNARSFTPTSNIRRLAGQQLALTREESSGPESDGSNGARPIVKVANKQAISKSSARGEPHTNLKAPRLKKQLTTHPSLESIGAYRSKNRSTEGPIAASSFDKTNSRSSTPNNHLIRPKDEMDEKINSILTSLPARIHLVPADQDNDACSVASSLPFKGRERFRSHSPPGTPSRSSTPTPSLTLRPARRRHSHAPEESSVKLYHLHRGGKSAPTKLFVRSVGENGERVMVRVGGGWADLGEYLREYAIHHGRRHVSETPRVEVEGLSARESPSYSPPASKLSPPGNSRHVSSRPLSVLSNRPSSSLAIRKTRRASNVSDMGDFRAASARAASAGNVLNASFSPMSSTFPRRRFSASSNVSAGAVSSISELRHGSPSAPAMPLGLAGPKPRAKHVSISPESEAWVEDVLGQARRSSSLRPFKYTLHDHEPAEANISVLPKARSISDIGKAGSSKRVALRGLGSR